MSKCNTYMLVEAYGLELPLFVSDTTKEIASYLGMKDRDIRSALARGTCIQRKYKIIKTNTDEEMRSPFYIPELRNGKLLPRKISYKKYIDECIQHETDIRRFATREACSRFCLQINSHNA